MGREKAPQPVLPSISEFTRTSQGRAIVKYKCPLCPAAGYAAWVPYHAALLHYPCPECGDYFVSLSHHERYCTGAD